MMLPGPSCLAADPASAQRANTGPPGGKSVQTDGADPSQNSFTVTFKTPDYQVGKDKDGFDVFTVAGYGLSGRPGAPSLPARTFDIALPPDVDMQSVMIKLIRADAVALPGSYRIAPARPPETWVKGGKIVSWGKDAPDISDGRNVGIYNNNAYFPASVAETAAYSQMRKWRFIRIAFTPFQYNPVTGQLMTAKEVDVRVSYNRLPVPQSRLQGELGDMVMDDRAEEMFYNIDVARSWYQAGKPQQDANAVTGYVIITTGAIKAGSAKLNDFVAQKQTKGYTVEIITENDYGNLTGQSPNGTAEKIRQWLKDNYQSKSIQQVLLIGNPDPFSTEVPMKMCWPRKGETEYPDYDQAPTDYYYADLTGNWDLNGNGDYGEYNGDRGTGGVDFTPEVYVGRIPVYTSVTGWAAKLDGILQKTMDYENETDIAWRQTALLPMSYSDDSTDGAPFAERIKSDYLNGAAYTSYTLYQHKSTGCNSSYASSDNLVGGAVRSRWQNNAYGIVTWWGHGSATSASVGYGSGDCKDGNLLASSDATVLDDAKPAFTYQCSCNNGYPENTNNLGYSLLKNGAVTTVSASRVSWYSSGSWTPRRTVSDNASIGYYYMKRIVGKDQAGKSLYDEKRQMSQGWGAESWMNMMDFNLYGDPALKIDNMQAPNTPTLVSPADNATGVAPMPTLKASDFSDPDGRSHANSHWQVARNSGFTSVTWDLGETYQAGVQATVPPGKLDADTAYYWRVRYKNSAGKWSSWSSSRSFTTSAVGYPVSWGNTKITAVFSDYGSSNGIWSNDGTNWSRLSDWIPSFLTGYGNTGIAATFSKYDTGNGIWRYEGSSWSKLTDWQPQTMLSYGSGKLAGKFSGYGSDNGIWKHEGSSWNRITDWLPDSMTPLGSSDLAGAFTDYGSGNGIWRYNGDSWARITDWAPERMLSWGTHLAAIFTNYGSSGNGVWIYEGTSWRRTTDWTPAKLLSWKNDTQLAAIFNNYGSGGNGVWNYNGSSWTRLTDWLPADMTKLGTEDLVAVFKDYGSSGNGVWKYSNATSSWQRVSDWMPDTISSSGDYITAVFINYGSAGNGVWKYKKDGNWTRLTDWQPKEPKP